MRFLLLSMLSALPFAAIAQSQSPATPPATDAPSPPTPKTTEVIAILTAKPGVSRQEIMSRMPAEIRATVTQYLEGKIRQWYSKADGRGVILVVDAKTVDEAAALIDAMPLSKERLVDHEYIPVGPLMPLAALLSR